jgi:hypothetical protein
MIRNIVALYWRLTGYRRITVSALNKLAGNPIFRAGLDGKHYSQYSIEETGHQLFEAETQTIERDYIAATDQTIWRLSFEHIIPVSIGEVKISYAIAIDKYMKAESRLRIEPRHMPVFYASIQHRQYVTGQWTAEDYVDVAEDYKTICACNGVPLNANLFYGHYLE